MIDIEPVLLVVFGWEVALVAGLVEDGVEFGVAGDVVDFDVDEVAGVLLLPELPVAGCVVGVAGPVMVYVLLGRLPFQTLDPEVLAMSDPAVRATTAEPAETTVKLMVAMAWVPDWTAVAAQARLTVVAVWEFWAQSVNGPVRVVLCQDNEVGNDKFTPTALTLSDGWDVTETATLRVLPTA